jgi:hypothetical protein
MQGSRSIQPQCNLILKRAWKSKDLPLLIKTFAWRLIRRALATAECARSYTYSDQHCDTCGDIETDCHLFFHCSLPSQVWNSHTPSILVHSLPAEEDGIQLTPQSIITPRTSDAAFNRIFFTLWYKWKARNDFHFNRKQWTSFQVHNAAQAHMNSLAAAFLPQAIAPLSTSQQVHQLPQGMSALPTGTAGGNSQHLLQETTLLHHDDEQAPHIHCQIHHDEEQALLRQHPHIDGSPVMAQGITCYTNASLTPNELSPNPRSAGLGVFINNTQSHPMQMVYIKATMQLADSVYMAEAAVLALAALVTDALGYQQVNLFSDNRPLVNFLNEQDQTNPPDWRIAPYTQIYTNLTSQRNTTIYWIPREQNQMTDNLSRQALSASLDTSEQEMQCNCASVSHDQCPIPEALQSVTLNHVWLLTAS